MRALSLYLLALAASVALYLGVFSVVQRPLTTGGMVQVIQAKSAYARTLARPRLLVFAGSNGRYSHRCSALTQATGLPCANLSLAVGVGLDFQLQQFEPELGRGDLLYLPLEYGQYSASRDEMDSGAQNAALVHDLRHQLWQLPALRIARALGSFDLPYLVHGVVEMGLARTGFQRRNAIGNSTPQGDEKDHTEAASVAYLEFLRAAVFDSRPLPQSSHAMDVVAGFLQRMKLRGVLVVGGLPSTPDNAALDAAGIERVRQLFLRQGQLFVALPNRSQYPLACFHDTLYHLNEECQIAHSLAIGAALADAVKQVKQQATAAVGGAALER